LVSNISLILLARHKTGFALSGADMKLPREEVLAVVDTAKQSESILFIPDRFYRETSHEMRMLGAN